jgi:hypothetical protein
MLYEMLAGRALFEVADSETPFALLLKHITEPPPLCPTHPLRQAVLTRALAKKRDERFQHAET